MRPHLNPSPYRPFTACLYSCVCNYIKYQRWRYVAPSTYPPKYAYHILADMTHQWYIQQKDLRFLRWIQKKYIEGSKLAHHTREHLVALLVISIKFKYFRLQYGCTSSSSFDALRILFHDKNPRDIKLAVRVVYVTPSRSPDSSSTI